MILSHISKMNSRQIQTLLENSKTSLTKLLQLHSFLIKTSLIQNSFIFSRTILSFSSISLSHARKLFQNTTITPPPLFAYNTLIRAYSHHPTDPLESINLFIKLRRTVNLKPDKFTYPFVIKACGRCSLTCVGGSVHSMVLKVGLGLDSHVRNTLLTMYGVCGVIEFSRKVFDEMSERDVVSWCSMIAAYVHCNRDLDALRVLFDMKMLNVKPNSITLVSLLAACTNLLNIRLGKSIHSYIIINGIELHTGLGTALLNIYAKSGHFQEAFHIFHFIREKNLKCWTVMISCLADSGQSEEAISLFRMMKENGFRPDSMSFTAILSACSHKGFVLEGKKLYEEMVNTYSIMPTMEHYGCMVDLYGRAGKIEEAYKIILSMPMEPNSVILRSYLSACKDHGRVLVSDKHLMQLLLKIEPEIAANYVLAGSVSPVDGYGSSVGEIRSDMKLKGLTKVPGSSWVIR